MNLIKKLLSKAFTKINHYGADPVFYDVTEIPEGMTWNDVLECRERYNLLPYDSRKRTSEKGAGFKIENL